MSAASAPQLKYFKLHYPAEYVAHVEINRPDKLNAFFDEMWMEMKTLFEYLSPHPDVRAILLSGAGDRAFTAGLDVTKAAAGDGPLLSTGFSDVSRKATYLRRHIVLIQSTVTAVANCEKPVICLMHGYAYGLGVDLSTACDIRLCASDTKFCVKEVDVGLAADVGTLSRLPKVLGGVSSWAKEVCLTARPFGPEEAVQNNLVSRVIPGGKQELMQEGMRVAQLIAKKSPVAVQGTKNILDAAWGRTVEDNLTYTAIWNAAMLQSNDLTRAMGGGFRKREPTFEKL